MRMLPLLSVVAVVCIGCTTVEINTTGEQGGQFGSVPAESPASGSLCASACDHVLNECGLEIYNDNGSIVTVSQCVSDCEIYGETTEVACVAQALCSISEFESCIDTDYETGGPEPTPDPTQSGCEVACDHMVTTCHIAEVGTLLECNIGCATAVANGDITDNVARAIVDLSCADLAGGSPIGGAGTGGDNTYCYDHTYNGDATGNKCFADWDDYCGSLCSETNPLSVDACADQCY